MKESRFNFSYDHRNCSSLFGYGDKVHRRCGYQCQLCGAGGTPVCFDFWRQLTVEHLIGEKQHGYLPAIRKAVAERFCDLSSEERERIAEEIDNANTVSACSFCNATTSHNSHTQDMEDLILTTSGDCEAVILGIGEVTVEILEKKRAEVAWKLQSVRSAFEEKEGLTE